MYGEGGDGGDLLMKNLLFSNQDYFKYYNYSQYTCTFFEIFLISDWFNHIIWDLISK